MPKTRPSLYLLWAGELLPEVCGASWAPDSVGTGCLYCGYCRNWAGDRWELCRCPVPQASLPPWGKMWGWDRALWVLWQDARSPEAMPVPASFTPPLVVGLRQTRPGWDKNIPLSDPPPVGPTSPSCAGDLRGRCHRRPLSGILAACVLVAHWLCTFW